MRKWSQKENKGRKSQMLGLRLVNIFAIRSMSLRGKLKIELSILVLIFSKKKKNPKPLA